VKQVNALAIVGFIAGTIGGIANWKLSLGNEWYPILLVILSTICVLYGGKIYLKK
jgi:hypothetical protein